MTRLRDEHLAGFDALRVRLDATGQTLRDRISSWLMEDGLKVHSVTYRLKRSESLREKLARPDRTYRSLWDVTDLLGLRIITYFEDDVDHVGKLLEGKLAVHFEHSKDRRSQSNERAFGYRSLHYVAGFSPDAQLHASARFEVQVRTVLEHAWAEIEHDLGYKAKDAMPAPSRRRLHRIAGLLELADQEFVAVRNELARYSEDLGPRLESEVVPLDLISVHALIHCEEVKGLDTKVATVLLGSLGRVAFYPDYVLRMLHASGFRSVAEVRAALGPHESAILALVKPYFDFANKAWSLSPFVEGNSMYCGYALFFLAHAKVLAGASLDVQRVERLAGLYQVLDYPDDPKAALDLAGQLAHAFRS
jgi:putative GTP pyrophosphokinase